MWSLTHRDSNPASSSSPAMGAMPRSTGSGPLLGTLAPIRILTPPFFPGCSGNAGQELLCTLMGRSHQDLPWRSRLNDDAPVHEDHAITDFAGERHLVRHY